MRLLRLAKYLLPGFPAVLLVPAGLLAWASLCVTHGERDWPFLLQSSPTKGGEPWYDEPLGYPFTFSGTWERRGPSTYGWTGFQMNWFLIDLLIALTVAYIFAMAVERLLFPLVLRLHRKKPEQ